MGIVVGEPFEDLGNTLEYTVGEFRAYEILPHNRVRLYLTEEKGSHHVLLYTAVVPLNVIAAMGRKCIEISGQPHVMPDWATEPMSKMAS